jgi:hypothetical protein
LATHSVCFAYASNGGGIGRGGCEIQARAVTQNKPGPTG